MKRVRLARLCLCVGVLILLSAASAFGGDLLVIGQGSPKPEDGNKLGNGYIYLNPAGKGATQFRISTEGSSIYIAKIKAYFEDGSTKEVSVGRTIAVEDDVEKSAPVALGPHKSPLEKVMVRFRSSRKAVITLWGG